MPYRARSSNPFGLSMPTQSKTKLSAATTSASARCEFDNLQLYKEADSIESEVDSYESDQQLPDSLIHTFAEATGWELAQVGDEIKIVDMSASWPAMTPTAHRGKCDVFAEELSKLLLQ